jgi:hypothetical protein
VGLATAALLLLGVAAAPPADACDFARHCAALDCWSSPIYVDFGR